MNKILLLLYINIFFILQEVTQNLWKQTFDQCFARPGSMYRGMPPNGKLYSLIDSNVEEDLLKGEVNSLEFRNLSWVAPGVKNLKKFKNLTRESLNLSVTVNSHIVP